MKVGIKLLPNYDKKWDLPIYKYIGDSGMDVRAAINNSVTLRVGDRVLIPTGIIVDIPMGYEVQVRPRSGLSLKQGIAVLNSPGTVDSTFVGQIGVILINLDFQNNKELTINHGDRIAQIVLKKVEEIEWVLLDRLTETDRGSGGFGSTGV